MKVIAAIDNTAAARDVLAAAPSIADLFDATLDVVHVRDDGSHTARAAAAAAGLTVREVTGSVVDTLVSEARRPDVTALVMGLRATPAGRRPAGHIALNVIAAAATPVALIPPDGGALRLERLLVPLDATVTTARGLEAVIESASAHELEVTVIHVITEDAVPAFSDQPHYEVEAWEHEFMARYCSAPGAKAELRVGVPGPAVLSIAKETRADLVALGWRQDLSPDRAAVVREVLDRSRVPVLLVPVLQASSAVAQFI